MKILIVGSGGREHALAWKIAQSPDVSEVLSVPGNPGMARYGRRLEGSGDNLAHLVSLAKENRVDLVVVGPEAPLTLGVVDELDKVGIPAFGPGRWAAQLEGSKVFAKTIMAEANVPTAEFESFEDPSKALSYVASRGGSCVVKADGLAAGKGVMVCETEAEARSAIHFLMEQGGLGGAGRRVVVEERLEGEEASFLVLCDGQTFVPLEAAQDHKRVGDRDQGPNTGGMGAYSPTPVVTAQVQEEITSRIIQPVLARMAEKGMPFKGVLYAGVMVTPGGAKLLEFNVRFGDPETQVILPRMESDLVPLMMACVEGRLNGGSVSWSGHSALCVVMVSGGYPGTYAKGKRIQGLEDAEAVSDAVIFQAGTEEKDGVLTTQGGRVLGVTGLGRSLRDAKSVAYSAVSKVRWEDCFYRKDIGWRAL